MKIAKIKGIEIKIHLSTLLIVFLVGFYAADFYYSLDISTPLIELILVGLINGIIILISILLHELTHSLVANRYGLKVTEIELYLFGGVSKIEQEPETPKSEFMISVLGPASSLIIGVLLLLPLWLIPIQIYTFIYVTLLYSGTSNIWLGLFNLIPAYPIDGGRILRAALWYKRHDLLSATKTAARIGNIMAYCLMGYGFFQILFFGFFNGLWLIIIASFLSNQSRHAYLQTLHEVTLSKIKVKEILDPIKLEIPFNMTINEAIKSYFMIYKKSFFPVVQNNNIVGIIHIEDLRKVPINERSNFIVGYAMKSVSQFPTISENENGKEVLRKLMQRTKRQNIVVVVDSNNKAIGFIGENELTSTIKFTEEKI